MVSACRSLQSIINFVETFWNMSKSSLTSSDAVTPIWRYADALGKRVGVSAYRGNGV